MNLSKKRDIITFEELWDLYCNGDISALIRRVYSQIKSGEIKVGSIVFWAMYKEFVKVAELPRIRSSHAVIQLSSGGTRETQISSLWKWWRDDERDEEFNKRVTEKITEEDKEAIIKAFEHFKSRDWFDTLKIVEVTGSGIVRIQLENKFANSDETRKMAHFAIEHIVKLTVPVVKAVVVEFIHKVSSSHIVGK